MPEAFKHIFNTSLVEHLASQLKQVYQGFDDAAFVAAVNCKLETLELKQRSDLICHQLHHFLPSDFAHTGQLLHAVLGERIDSEAPDATRTNPSRKTGVNGWAVMPLADYVAQHGMAHFDLSMDLLREMTKRSSSEFAIRPFLDQNTEQTMKILHRWAEDKDEHVRRLASEGSRPRLPWGMRLKKFVTDPSPLLPLLDKLKDDSSEYVRRSVANNLNDISKDHPDLVASVALDWMINASEARIKLVRHACRSLIKVGHAETLQALGYGNAELGDCTLTLSAPTLDFGGSLQLSVTIPSKAKHSQELMIDYIVYHQKANGTVSPKVFKWRSVHLASGKTLTVHKKHTIKPITTRTYYPGVHKIEVQVNGTIVAENAFELFMP
ncbi:DNA alkylation repair protein [Vibrio sp. RC27]